MIERVARERGAEVIHTSEADVAFDIHLAGSHQRANAAVAVRLLEILDAHGIRVPAHAVAAGLADPRWPGRLETRRLPDGREMLLDAAHNPAGAAVLASYLLSDRGVARPLVFAAMRDKDVAGMFTRRCSLRSAVWS